MEQKKVKKAIFKRWWFWIIAVPVTLFGLLMAVPTDTPSDETTTITKSILTSQTEVLTNESTQNETEKSTTQKETTKTTTKKVTTTKKPTTSQKATTQKGTTKSATKKVTTTKIITIASTAKKVTTTKKNIDNSRIVYRTETGSKYHYENPCGNGTYYEISLDDAEATGLEPCKKCVLN